MNRGAILSLATAAAGSVAACTSQFGSLAPGPGASIENQVTAGQRFDAHRAIGLMAAGPPLPFVANAAFLAGPTPDSTLVLLGLSMANQSLSFQRGEGGFHARYEVTIVLESGDREPEERRSEHLVRVAGFSETRRRDESVIFQDFAYLPPGPARVSISVQDRFGGRSAKVESDALVRRYAAKEDLSSLIPVYQAGGRLSLDERPDLVMNPRATARYGDDSLAFYVEAYGAPEVTYGIARAADRSGREVWRDTVWFGGPGNGVLSATLRLPASVSVPGKLSVQLGIADRRILARAPALIAVADDWTVTQISDVASLLRYFRSESGLTMVADTQAVITTEEWSRFWKDTDPDPGTPANEALNRYFARLTEANRRFSETDKPGWLCDRGRVFMLLGEPNQTYHSAEGPESSGPRVIRWQYLSEALTLHFVDATGMGNYRLTPASEADLTEALQRSGWPERE